MEHCSEMLNDTDYCEQADSLMILKAISVCIYSFTY